MSLLHPRPATPATLSDHKDDDTADSCNSTHVISTTPLLVAPSHRRQAIERGSIEKLELKGRSARLRTRCIALCVIAGLLALTSTCSLYLRDFPMSSSSSRESSSTNADSNSHPEVLMTPLKPLESMNAPNYDTVLESMRRVNNTYCAAKAISKESYRSLNDQGYLLRKVIVIVRHGDRAPNNVMTDDLHSGIEWDCKNKIEYSFLHDTRNSDSDTPVSTTSDSSHNQYWPKFGSDTLLGRKVVNIGEDAWKPRMWKGSCLKAELTDRGRRQLVDLGNHLREIYINELGFLKSNFTYPSHLHVRATDIPRTIHSAQSLIEGLYPTFARPAHVMPVSLHTHPLDTDPLHSNKLFTLCPRLATLKSKYSTTEMWQTYLRQATPFLSHVNRLIKLKGTKESMGIDAVANYDDVNHNSNSHGKNRKKSIKSLPSSPEPVHGITPLTENLWCRSCWDKPLPCARGFKQDGNTTINSKCISQSDNQLLHHYKSFEFYFKNNYFPNFFEPEIVRLEMGPLLHGFVNLLNKTRNTEHYSNNVNMTDNNMHIEDEEDERKMYVYLTHDGTMSGLLGALQAIPEQHMWPSYRANLIIELLSKPSNAITIDNTVVSDTLVDPIVRIMYDGVPLRVHNDWCSFGSTISGNDSSTMAAEALGCPLSTFIKFLEERTTPDWEEACQQ